MDSSLKIVGLILAKKDSKRLHNKNWRDFAGKPMFIWNLEKALQLFSEVYVSSDFDPILKKAESLGAIAIKRPEELCGETPNITVYKHAQHIMKADAIVAIQANSPSLDLEIIETVINLMEDGNKEVKTCHSNGDDYGSIWAMTKERLANYPDPYKAKPDVWVKDISVDIHGIKDLQQALSDYEWTK